MPEIIEGHIYDYPTYYDLLFGSDWKAEFDFLEACFEKHARRDVRRVFEPACGTGRLLIKLARAGYEVFGNDLNPRAVRFCNERFRRHALPPAAVVGDMAAFRLSRRADAAFNTISSFRHLETEAAAECHLWCMSNALAKGGLYVLGMHLLPTRGHDDGKESWSARRGNLSVVSRMWSKEIDRRKRMESLGITFDVYTPTRHLQIVDELHYRTYTARQMRRLFAKVPSLEVAATYDFAYDIDRPIAVTPETCDVVYVLRKK